MKKDLMDLMLLGPIQTRIVSLLKVMGLIEGQNFATARLTPKAEKLIASDLIDQHKVQDFIEIFPVGHRNNASLVQSKMTRFMKSHPQYSYEDLCDAAERWVQMKGEYCGDAKYFFYKKTEGGEESRCLQVLQMLEHRGHVI